jgi:hypothetical protein
MEGSCSTGQSPQWAVVPVEEEVIFSAISILKQCRMLKGDSTISKHEYYVKYSKK